MAKIICEYTPTPDKKIRLVHGDITDENVDAIVNAANSHLSHGGGVAGAIVRKGGDVIQQESNKIGHVPVGECAVTGAGKLHAKYVIHAVGPMLGEGEEDSKLTNAISNSLKMAAQMRLKSISFPAVSSGIFGFPKDRCAKILIEGAVNYCKENPESSLHEIRFCIIDKVTLDIFELEFNRVMK